MLKGRAQQVLGYVLTQEREFLTIIEGGGGALKGEHKFVLP